MKLSPPIREKNSLVPTYGILLRTSVIGCVAGAALLTLGIIDLAVHQPLGLIKPFSAVLVPSAGGLFSVISAIGIIICLGRLKEGVSEKKKAEPLELDVLEETQEELKRETQEELKKRIHWSNQDYDWWWKRGGNLTIPESVSKYLGPANYFFVFCCSSRFEVLTLHERLKIFQKDIQEDRQHLPTIVVIFRQGAKAELPGGYSCTNKSNSYFKSNELPEKFGHCFLRYAGLEDQYILDPDAYQEEQLKYLKNTWFT